MSSGIPNPDVDKQSILEALPNDVTRICVTDEDGNIRYRYVQEVHLTDILMFNKKGTPVVMRGASGRPSDDPKAPLPKVQDTSKFVPVTNRTTTTVSNTAPKTPHATNIFQDDAVMSTVKDDPESLDVLHNVMVGLAEEAAAMAHARKLLEAQGKNTSNVSAKRVSALRAIGDTWMKRKDQLGSQSVDIDSIAFKRVFGFIMETFRSSLIASKLRPEQVEVIFAELAKKMGEDWIAEAKKRAESED